MKDKRECMCGMFASNKVMRKAIYQDCKNMNSYTKCSNKNDNWKSYQTKLNSMMKVNDDWADNHSDPLKPLSAPEIHQFESGSRSRI